MYKRILVPLEHTEYDAAIVSLANLTNPQLIISYTNLPSTYKALP